MTPLQPAKFACVILALLALAGCTTTEIDEFRQTQTSITSDESIVILGRRQKNDYETESDFINCVATVVSSGNDGISVVPEKQFQDALFPFFEPRTAPMRTSHLRQLMSVDVAKQRLEDFGVKYIVWVDGLTQRSESAGTMSCTIGPGGGGCFGFGTWVDDSKFEAEIWDMATLDVAGSISTDANGQSYMPAVVVPIPLIARVEANACSALGNQLKNFIIGS